MGTPYQVLEPSEQPGEYVLVHEFEGLNEAIEAAQNGQGRVIEERDGLTSRVYHLSAEE